MTGTIDRPSWARQGGPTHNSKSYREAKLDMESLGVSGFALNAHLQKVEAEPHPSLQVSAQWPSSQKPLSPS